MKLANSSTAMRHGPIVGTRLWAMPTQENASIIRNTLLDERASSGYTGMTRYLTIISHE